MEIFVDTITNAIVNAPVEKVDLTDWLFTLTDNEYQKCSTAHIAAGTSLNFDGKRISLNVEMIGDSLLVHHYVEEIGKNEHCSVRSLTDAYSSGRWTKMEVTWELTVEKINETSCYLHNRIQVSPSDQVLEALKSAGPAAIEQVKERMLKNTKNHNEEETPLFAKNIEIKALAGCWD
jgi:hypothetical protein